MSKKTAIVLLALIAVLTITNGSDDTASLKGAPTKVAADQDVPTILYNVHPSNTPGFLTPPKPNYNEINSRLSAAKVAPNVIPASSNGYQQTSGNTELDNASLIPPTGFIPPNSPSNVPLRPIPPPSGSTGQRPYPVPVNSNPQLNIPQTPTRSNVPQSYSGPSQILTPPNPGSPKQPLQGAAAGKDALKYPIDHTTNYKPPANPRPRGPVNIGSSISITSSQPGGSNRQCTFSVSNDNEFHPSSDDFGYPKYQVEDAFEASIAKSVFEKYMDHPKGSSSSSGGLPSGIGLSGFNSVPGQLGGSSRPQSIPQNNPSNAAIRPAPRSQYYGFDPNSFNSENGIQNKFNNIDNSAGSPFSHNQFPSFQGNSGPFSGNVFSNNGLSSFHFRRRRMAGFQSIDFGQDVKDICPAVTKQPVKSFKKYGSTCFVWEPAKQKLAFVTCSNDKCGKCRRRNTSSKCMAENVERWVWAYCEQGPYAGQMSLEQIKIPTHCTCKVYEC